MLIEVTREVAGQLDDGWFHGLYWRCIRSALMPAGNNQQALVYIQVLIPDSSFDLRLQPLSWVGGLQPLYHEQLDCGLSLARVTWPYGGFRRDRRMQWFETYYGKQYIQTDTGHVIECSVQYGWHPATRGQADIYASPRVFMRHIQPAAQHVCCCIIKARSVPVSASHEPAILPSQSAL